MSAFPVHKHPTVMQFTKSARIAFGGGAKLSAEDGFYSLWLNVSSPAMHRREEIEDEDQEETGDSMKPYQHPIHYCFVNCAGRTLCRIISAFGRVNEIAVARSHEVSPGRTSRNRAPSPWWWIFNGKATVIEAIDPVGGNRRILDEELYGMERVEAENYQKPSIRLTGLYTLPACGRATNEVLRNRKIVDCFYAVVTYLLKFTVDNTRYELNQWPGTVTGSSASTQTQNQGNHQGMLPWLVNQSRLLSSQWGSTRCLRPKERKPGRCSADPSW